MSSILMRRHLTFFLVLSALVACALVRSCVATKHDSFTFDEAYHIGAGAAYVKTVDFRLNPEHPPLVKLWVGAFVSSQGFQLSPYRAYQDKHGEREAVERDVYFNNDPDTVQRRSRAAMFALNGLLLFLFALAARRLFGAITALAATGFLVIDPTIAAHLPVVMTDLPVALLSATAVLFAVAAFRSWRLADLVLATITLGLALSAKHSAIVTVVAVALIGMVMVSFSAGGANALVRLRRAGGVAVVVIGSVVVLWSFYLFRFAENPKTSEEQFNRPLAVKISDVKSPLYRAGLNVMAHGRLFPRAYTWGMADTIRAGAEGRAIPILAFGSLYFSKAPFYYFPGVIAVKMPLGLLLLATFGTGLVLARKVPREWVAPLTAVTGLAVLFLLVLITGSSYGGIRHALPVVPALALLGALTIHRAIKTKSHVLRSATGVALLAALLSAIPAQRPWEYYNETIGGSANAYRYFNDEGIDLSLHTKELVDYYNQNLKPHGEVPYVVYFSSRMEWRRRGLDWVGKEPERDAQKIFGETMNGTFILGAGQLAPSLYWDFGKTFRDTTPVARVGNLFVYRGTFPASHAAQAASLYFQAMRTKLYTDKPDVASGIKMLSRSVELDPQAFFVALELGNQYLKVSDREGALRAYRIARENAPASDSISILLARQIDRVQAEPLEQVQPLRNPGVE